MGGFTKSQPRIDNPVTTKLGNGFEKVGRGPAVKPRPTVVPANVPVKPKPARPEKAPIVEKVVKDIYKDECE